MNILDEVKMFLKDKFSETEKFVESTIEEVGIVVYTELVEGADIMIKNGECDEDGCEDVILPTGEYLIEGKIVKVEDGVIKSVEDVKEAENPKEVEGEGDQISLHEEYENKFSEIELRFSQIEEALSLILQNFKKQEKTNKEKKEKMSKEINQIDEMKKFLKEELEKFETNLIKSTDTKNLDTNLNKDITLSQKFSMFL